MAWSNSARSRLYLQRVKADALEANPDERVLSTMKANYAAAGAERRVEYRNGVFEPITGGASGPKTRISVQAANTKAERVLGDLLRKSVSEGWPVNPSGGSTYAPTAFAEHSDSEGITKGAFKAAMRGLLARGVIRTEEQGPPSKRRNYLVPVYPTGGEEETGNDVTGDKIP